MAINPCVKFVKKIDSTECLSDSLAKINNNFLNLEEVVCDIKQKIDISKAVRTFFYYGPNSETDAASNMMDNKVSRPSDLTIRAFVNSSTQLDLTSISRPGDVAYVVYQKTGWLNNQLVGVPIEFGDTFLGLTPSDTFNTFAPIFVVWRLTYVGVDYTVDVGYPRFVQAQTDGSSTFWSTPQNWSQY